MLLAIGARRRWIAAAAALGIAALEGCEKKETKPISLSRDSVSLLRSETPKPGPPLPPAPPVTSADAALRRMVAAYRELGSLYYRSESSFTLTLGNPVRVEQTSVAKVRREPPGVAFDSLDRVAGTAFYMGDGSSLVVYSGKTNSYQRHAAVGDLAVVCRAAVEKSGAVLSPLEFFYDQDLIEELRPVGSLKNTTYQGKPALQISAVLPPDYMQAVARRTFRASLKPVRSDVVFTVDPQSFLLLKTDANLAWSGAARVEVRPRTWAEVPNPKIELHERFSNVMLNPSFKQDEFRFIPPSGSRQRPVEGVRR